MSSDDMTGIESHPPSVRPLIVRFGALGDMVLLGAAIRELSARYQSPIDVVTSGDWSKVVLEGQPGVGVVYRIKSRKRPYWLSPSQWRLIQQLKRRAPGPVWFLDPTDVGLKLLHRAGISQNNIVCFNSFSHSTSDHIVSKTARVIRCSPKAFPSNFRVSLIEEAFTASLLDIHSSWKSDLDQWLRGQPFGDQKLILFQAGNSVTTRRGRLSRATNYKYWPLRNWAKVIQHCADLYPNHALLLIGQPSEYPLNQKIKQLVQRPHLYNVAHDVPLTRLIALCNASDALISVDTGPAHIAAAVGLPMVVLFGSSRPEEYKPVSALGSQVLCVDTPRPPYLRHLTVEPVLKAVDFLQLKMTPLL